MTKTTTTQTDHMLLPHVVAAVATAGETLRDRFDTDSRPKDLDDVLTKLAANDDAVLAILRPSLQALRPHAGWVEDELDHGALPDGEWWVTDPAEGNINHIHGLTEWAVTATLVRDNQPVLAVVFVPLTGDTYTAVRGGGAHLNGKVLQASAKSDVNAAYVGTGQAWPGESAETLHRIATSLGSALTTALVTRSSVPATMQLIQVAAGRMDAFWQFSDVRSGLAAGALLVAEADGVVTDVAGEPWSVASPDLLAAAPGLHAAMVSVLGDDVR